MKSNFDYISLGKRIRAARKRKGFTQEKLAEACDLSTAHIGHAERGTRALSIESLAAISMALDISVDYLLLGTSGKGDVNLSSILNAVKKAPGEKKDRFYSVVKIIAENIDEL